MFLITLLFIGQTELLLNGDFENWVNYLPEGWIKETSSYQLYQDSLQVYSGNYSAKFVLRSDVTQRLTQIVYPITPGNMYIYTLHVLDNDTMGKLRGYLRFYDGEGNQVAYFYTSYSDDGSTWQLLKTDTFICPQNAETLHVEIRLYDNGSWQAGDSAVFWVDSLSLQDLGPAPDPPYHPISDIQGLLTSSPYEDSLVKTSGIVTATFGNNFFIEEYPGGLRKGLYVYRGSASSPAVHIGDSVLVKGKVAEYYGNTQLSNVFDIQVLQTGHPLPSPIELTPQDTITEDHEGVYVHLTDAECINDSLGYGEWEINYRYRSTQKDTFLHVDNMGVDYMPQVGGHYSILGVITFTYGDFKIEPRDSQDIRFLNITEHNNRMEKKQKTYIFSSLDEASKMCMGCDIFDAFGRKIGKTGSMDTNNIKRGIYFIKSQKGNFKYLKIK